MIITLPAQRNYTLLLAAVLFISAGCFEGAPRRHPLDPQGENFNDAGGISVLVTNFYAPLQGLPDATVFTSPGSFFGSTDAQGKVFIPDLTSGVYTLTIEKAGFAPRLITIDVVAGETMDVEVSLPGLPVFTQINLNTVHISRWWPPPEELYRLQLNVVIDDPDGLADVEEVWLEIPDFDYQATLDPQITPGRFSLLTPETDLPAALPALAGHEIILYARDRSSTVNKAEGLTIFRIIDASPLAQSPQGLTLLNTSAPALTWAPALINYPFSYQIDVVRVDNNVQNLVTSFEDVPSDSISIQTKPLPPGEYFWTVSIVDEFGNRSRSREAGFRIP